MLQGLFMITGSQVRAARALLNWTQDTLAVKAGVAPRTITLFEADKRRPYEQTLSQLQSALEANGIRFLESEVGIGVMVVVAATPAKRSAGADDAAASTP